MKKTNKRIVAILLMAAMVLSLFGCGVKSKDSNSDYEYDPTAKAELSGEFELQIFTGGYGSEAWEEVIAAFEEEYPELDVVAYMDSNVNKKMQSRWMQGNPPDFVFLAGSNLPEMTYMEEGKFLDLTSFYDKATLYDSDELLKDHLKGEYIKYYEEKVMSLPILVSTYGMWSDAAYMKQLGLNVPTNYDELLQLGKDAKAKNVDTIIYPGTSANYLTNGLIFPALAVYGQEYFDRITQATDVDAFKDERFRTVMERFEAVADAGLFSEGTVSLNHTQSQMQWLSHKALMIPNGLWLENEMKKDIPDGFEMKYALGMLNKADEEQYVVTSASCIAVSSDGDNKEAALEFIRFLYREENIIKFAEMANIPITTDADMSGTKLSESAQYVQEVLSNPELKSVNLNLAWGSVDSVFIDCVNQIVLGTIDTDKAIDMLVEAVEKKLEGY